MAFYYARKRARGERIPKSRFYNRIEVETFEEATKFVEILLQSRRNAHDSMNNYDIISTEEYNNKCVAEKAEEERIKAEEAAYLTLDESAKRVSRLILRLNLKNLSRSEVDGYKLKIDTHKPYYAFIEDHPTWEHYGFFCDKEDLVQWYSDNFDINDLSDSLIVYDVAKYKQLEPKVKYTVVVDLDI
jgi:hypothetical protein